MQFVCAECGESAGSDIACPRDGTLLRATDDPMLGTEIGRYRIARLLGAGGMGRVYLGVQPQIGSRVAIKVLSDECARDPALLQRFFSEARAVNLIRHEHIVGVLDLAQLPDGRPYIVMEFIDGRTLATFARGGTASIGGVISVIVEVLGALGAAHAIGIIHRDLKPDNVLVTNEGHCKVLDFGIAKLAPGLQSERSPRTQTGALLGTPSYMAPEQIVGGQIDARTDIYAAGVVLFEAITGNVPFASDTLFELMRAHLESEPPSPRIWRPDLPVAIEQVILRALAKKPEDRFPSAAAMADALHAASVTLKPGQWTPLTTRSGARGRRGPDSLPPPLAMQSPRVMPSPRSLALAATAVSPPPTVARTRKRMFAAAIVAGVVAVGLVIGARWSGDPATGTATAANAPAPVIVTSTPAVPVSPPAGPVLPDPSPSPSPSPAPPPDPVVTPRPSPLAPRPEPPTPTPTPTPTPAKHHGPIIIGGGSAADHGVFLGSNVEIGDNVIIGSSTPATPSGTAPKRIDRRADFDPHHFDPLAYLPKALATAREIYPDAQLIRFDFGKNVYPDGHVDLSLPSNGGSTYDFRSPSHSTRPPGLPSNSQVDMPCRVLLEVSPHGVEAHVATSETCRERTHQPPHCTFAEVWAKAKAAGMPSDNLVATIDFLPDGTWFFDLDDNKHIESYVDRCP